MADGDTHPDVPAARKVHKAAPPAELKPTSLLRSENVRSILAYFIVIGLLAFIIAMTMWKGIDAGERVAAICTGIIGAVVGFYFGRQGFDKALQRANVAEQASAVDAHVKNLAEGTANQLKDTLAETTKEYDDLFEAYKAQIAKTAKNVKSKLGQ
jgi:uncharacterized membrane protein YeaQ/YmgE (transglycosylase-associated protein family)